MSNGAIYAALSPLSAGHSFRSWPPGKSERNDAVLTYSSDRFGRMADRLRDRVIDFAGMCSQDLNLGGSAAR